MNYLIAAKVCVEIVLFSVFINFFGLESLERYQEKAVVTTTSAKQPAFMAAPAVTICPTDLKTHLGFHNITKNDVRAANGSFSAAMCSESSDPTLEECFEKKVIKLNEMVLYVSAGIKGEKQSPSLEKWTFTFSYHPCYTFTTPRHMGTDNFIHSIVLGLSDQFSYRNRDVKKAGITVVFKNLHLIPMF